VAVVLVLVRTSQHPWTFPVTTYPPAALPSSGPFATLTTLCCRGEQDLDAAYGRFDECKAAPVKQVFAQLSDAGLLEPQRLGTIACAVLDSLFGLAPTVDLPHEWLVELQVLRTATAPICSQDRGWRQRQQRLSNTKEGGGGSGSVGGSRTSAATAASWADRLAGCLASFHRATTDDDDASASESGGGDGTNGGGGSDRGGSDRGSGSGRPSPRHTNALRQFRARFEAPIELTDCFNRVLPIPFSGTVAGAGHGSGSDGNGGGEAPSAEVAWGAMVQTVAAAVRAALTPAELAALTSVQAVLATAVPAGFLEALAAIITTAQTRQLIPQAKWVSPVLYRHMLTSRAIMACKYCLLVFCLNP
jgi:hypothetical protein